jgi:hypothetical protein
MSLRELVNTVFRNGRCVASAHSDRWFPEEPRGRDALALQRRYAREACAQCPVQVECLVVALSHEQESGASWGIWGGVCARDRKEAIERARRHDPEGPADFAAIAQQLLPVAEPFSSCDSQQESMTTMDSAQPIAS